MRAEQQARNERDGMLDLFERHQPDFLERARDVAAALCREHGSCTVDDVRKACPPPANTDPRVMGAIFRAPRFEKIGYENSNRATCHARPIARFRLAPQ